MDRDVQPAPLASDRCLHELFEARAAAQPAALAARDGTRDLRYAELDRDADRVAHDLLAAGLAPEERVGVFADRSLEYLVAILGVLKAGGAYLPLDPHQPDERLRYMRENGGARIVLGERRFASRVPGGVVPIDVATRGAPAGVRARRATPRSLAYVIYTSGSTGRPKGVMVEHASVVNLVDFYRSVFRLGPGDRCSQVHRPGFDACVAEIWPALACGASLHFPDEQTYLDPVRLFAWLASEGIAICDLPTVLAEAAIATEPPPCPRLRAFVTGGDKLRRRPAASFPWPLYDQYGPTEATVCATMARVEPEGAPGPLHVGRALPGCRVHVLDAALRPVATGETGEIYIGGAGLARGYLGAPEESAARFVADRAEPGTPLYRTGDLGRILPDGNLECLGRLDHQVKVRGFRIELEEIERSLAAHPGVREALAQAVECDGSQKRLVAHYVPQGGAPAGCAELRAWLAERLPHFMVPAAIVAVAEWPRTANGKIDRAALADAIDASGAAAPVAPRNDTEERLAAIWRDVLGAKRIGVADDFFEIGGDSLLAARIAARVERELGALLPLALFFSAPTIGKLADHLRGERPIRTTPGLVPLATRGTRPPVFFLPGLGGHVLAFRALARALGPDQPSFGLQDPALEGGTAPFATVEAMAGHYLELARTAAPPGPLLLAGYSLGGLVALEMAQQHLRSGGDPAFVALIDTPAPGFPPKLPLAERLRAHVRNVTSLPAASRAAYLRERLGNVVARVPGFARDPYEQSVWGVLTPRMRQVLRAHGEAGDAYTVAPYPGRIALLRASVHPDWPATSFDDPHLGWERFAGGGVDAREVPGAHLDVLDAPHAPRLADALAGALEAFAARA
jgi:amino acid adenylation domain-containing protein